VTDHTIGYIVGSISSTSINRRLAKALEKVAPEGVTLKEIPIKDLPFYSPDYDGNFPQVAVDFKNAIEDADAVFIVTPEYSRSIPGVLKNALDWSARPYGEASFNDKPTAVIGQPEGYIQSTPGLFEEDGTVTDEGTAAFLRSIIEALVTLAQRTAPAPVPAA